MADNSAKLPIFEFGQSTVFYEKNYFSIKKNTTHSLVQQANCITIHFVS